MKKIYRRLEPRRPESSRIWESLSTIRIILGHGPLASRKDLLAYKDMLSTFREIIIRETEAGKTLEQILKDQKTAELDEEYGSRFRTPEQFTRAVFETLGGPLDH